MTSIKLRLLAVTAFLLAAPSLGHAQTAEQVLQNPALLRELKARIMSSGLSPDQVRARLRAEGYPENLLDAYLSGGDSGEATGTTGTGTQADVLGAVSALGIVDTVDALTLRCSAQVLSGDTTLTAKDTVNIGRERALAQRAALRQACASRENRLSTADSLALRLK